eukprot:TRINITY_DN5961_c1_g1_i1.p1 TRINITY_DN5961_c1_g1~~TRINITY_DN5961_c1_g1_i1.p1  ORF type:complete len:5354 (+),score=1646.49 TRINITY_DN5961_c1_g1_i1:1689-16064(+)
MAKPAPEHDNGSALADAATPHPSPTPTERLCCYGSSADGRHALDAPSAAPSAVFRISGLGMVDGEYIRGPVVYTRAQDDAPRMHIVPVHGGYGFYEDTEVGAAPVMVTVNTHADRLPVWELGLWSLPPSTSAAAQPLPMIRVDPHEEALPRPLWTTQGTQREEVLSCAKVTSLHDIEFTSASGLYVRHVRDFSAWEAAGFERGVRIVAVNKRRGNAKVLKGLLAAAAKTQAFEVTVISQWVWSLTSSDLDTSPCGRMVRKVRCTRPFDLAVSPATSAVWKVKLTGNVRGMRVGAIITDCGHDVVGSHASLKPWWLCSDGVLLCEGRVAGMTRGFCCGDVVTVYHDKTERTISFAINDARLDTKFTSIALTSVQPVVYIEHETGCAEIAPSFVPMGRHIWHNGRRTESIEHLDNGVTARITTGHPGATVGRSVFRPGGVHAVSMVLNGAHVRDCSVGVVSPGALVDAKHLKEPMGFFGLLLRPDGSITGLDGKKIRHPAPTKGFATGDVITFVMDLGPAGAITILKNREYVLHTSIIPKFPKVRGPLAPYCYIANAEARCTLRSCTAADLEEVVGIAAAFAAQGRGAAPEAVRETPVVVRTVGRPRSTASAAPHLPPLAAMDGIYTPDPSRPVYVRRDGSFHVFHWGGRWCIADPADTPFAWSDACDGAAPLGTTPLAFTARDRAEAAPRWLCLHVPTAGPEYFKLAQELPRGAIPKRDEVVYESLAGTAAPGRLRLYWAHRAQRWVITAGGDPNAREKGREKALYASAAPALLPHHCASWMVGNGVDWEWDTRVTLTTELGGMEFTHDVDAVSPMVPTVDRTTTSQSEEPMQGLLCVDVAVLLEAPEAEQAAVAGRLPEDELAGLHLVKSAVVSKCTGVQFRAALRDAALQFSGVPELLVTSAPPAETIAEICGGAERHLACARKLFDALRDPDAPDPMVTNNWYPDAMYGAVQSKSLASNIIDVSRLPLLARKAFLFSLFKRHVSRQQVLHCFPPPPPEEVRRFLMMYGLLRAGLVVVYGLQELSPDLQEDVRKAAEDGAGEGKRLVGLVTASLGTASAKVDAVDLTTCDVRWRRTAHSRIAALRRVASVTYYDHPPGTGKSFAIDAAMDAARWGPADTAVRLDLDATKTVEDVVKSLLAPLQAPSGVLVIHVAHDTPPALLNSVLDGLVLYGGLCTPTGVSLTADLQRWHLVIEFQSRAVPHCVGAAPWHAGSWLDEGVMVLDCRELAEQGALVPFDINTVPGAEQALMFMRTVGNTFRGSNLVMNGVQALRMLAAGVSNFPAPDSWERLTPAAQRKAGELCARELSRAAKYLALGYTTFCTSQGFGEKELQLLVAFSLKHGVRSYLSPSAPNHFHLIVTDTVRAVAMQLAGSPPKEVHDALNMYLAKIRHSSAAMGSGLGGGMLKTGDAEGAKSISQLTHVLSEQLGVGIRACTNLIAQENYVLTGVFLQKLIQTHERARLQDPVILQGPSGTGKTHAVRMLCKLFDLPPVKRGQRRMKENAPRPGSVDMLQALLHFCRRDVRMRCLFPNNVSDQIGESKGVLWQAEFRPPHAKCLDCLAVLNRGRHKRAIKLVVEELHNLLGPITSDPRSYPEVAQLRADNPSFGASLAYILKRKPAVKHSKTTLAPSDAVETVLTELSNRLLSADLIAGLEKLFRSASMREILGGDYVEVVGILDRNIAQEAVLEWAQEVPRRVGPNYPALMRVLRGHIRGTLRSSPTHAPDAALRRLLAGDSPAASGREAPSDGTALRRLLSLYLDVKKVPTHCEVLMSYSVTPAALFAQVRPILERARAAPRLLFTVVIDEMSATNMLGLLKRVIVDRRWDLWGAAHPETRGHLPRNVAFVGLVNASDRVSHTPPQGGRPAWVSAAAETPEDLGQTAAMNEFNVGILPASLHAYHVPWPQMETAQSELLIACIMASNRSIFRHHVSKTVVTTLQEMFAKAHYVVHTMALARGSTISQRHIHRAMRVFEFFFARGESFLSGPAQAARSVNDLALSSMTVAVAVSYFFGLVPQERARLDREVSAVVKFGQHAVHCGGRAFSDVVMTAVRHFTGPHLRLPPGVYPHKALLENLFVQIVCFELRLAVILHGPPGTSKTLSNAILRSNMNGSGEFWSKLCSVTQVAQYQASAHTTTDDVERKCKEAQAIQQQHDTRGYNSKRCLLFIDEAGLVSGRSGQRALKVLHYYLEDADLASVLISNQELDPAITNRCVKVHMSRPSADELAGMCEQIVCGKAHSITDTARAVIAGSCRALYTLLGLDDDNPAQERYRWWYGMRDLFHMMRSIRRGAIAALKARPKPRSVFDGATPATTPAFMLPRMAHPLISTAAERDGDAAGSGSHSTPEAHPEWMSHASSPLLEPSVPQTPLSPMTPADRRGSAAAAEPLDITPDVFAHALERNFNGPQDMFDTVLSCFGAHLAHVGVEKQNVADEGSFSERALRALLKGKLDVLLLSLAERRELAAEHQSGAIPGMNDMWPRFALVADETGGGILNLLCQSRIAPFQDVQVLSVSALARADRLTSVEVVSQVGAAMEAGQTVWLTNTRSVDACLFDLLNQSFVFTRTSRGEHVYFAALAIGGALEYKRVHPEFQCIVHVTQKEVDAGAAVLPAPFLNRLEKFTLCAGDVMNYALGRLASAALTRQAHDLREKLLHFARRFPMGVATAFLEDTCDSLILEAVQDGWLSRVYVSERISGEVALRGWLLGQDEATAVWRSLACRILQLVLPEAMLLAQDVFARGAAAYLWAYFRALQPWSLKALLQHLVRRAEAAAAAPKRVLPQWSRVAVVTPRNVDHAGFLHNLAGCVSICAAELLSADSGRDDLGEAILSFAANPAVSVFVVVMEPDSYAQPETREIMYALSSPPEPLAGFKTVVVLQTYHATNDPRPPGAPLFGMGWDQIFVDAGAENLGVSLLDYVSVPGLGGLGARPTPEWRLVSVIVPQALNGLLQAQEHQQRWKQIESTHDRAAALYNAAAPFEKQVRIAKHLFRMLPKLRRVVLALCTKLQRNLAAIAGEVTERWCADRGQQDGVRSLGELLLREEQKVPTAVLTHALFILLDRRAATALCRLGDDATAASQITFADAVLATAVEVSMTRHMRQGVRRNSPRPALVLHVPASYPTFPASYALRRLLPDVPVGGSFHPATVNDIEKLCPPAVRNLLHTFASDDELLLAFFEDTVREFIPHDGHRAVEVATKWATEIAKRHHHSVLPGTKESVCSIHCLAHYERAAVVDIVAAVWPLAVQGVLDHATVAATLTRPQHVKDLAEIVHDALIQALPALATSAPQLIACIGTVLHLEALSLAAKPHIHITLLIAQRVLQEDAVPLKELLAVLVGARANGALKGDTLAALCTAVREETLGPILLAVLRVPSLGTSPDLIRCVIGNLHRVPREMACEILKTLLLDGGSAHQQLGLDAARVGEEGTSSDEEEASTFAARRQDLSSSMRLPKRDPAPPASKRRRRLSAPSRYAPQSQPSQRAPRDDAVSPAERLRRKVYAHEPFFPGFDDEVWRAAQDPGNTPAVRAVSSQGKRPKPAEPHPPYIPPSLCDLDAPRFRGDVHLALFDVTFAVLTEGNAVAAEERLLALMDMLVSKRQLVGRQQPEAAALYTAVQIRAGEEAFLQQLAVVFATGFHMHGRSEEGIFAASHVLAPALPAITAVARSLLEPTEEFTKNPSDEAMPAHVVDNNLALVAAVETQLAAQGVRRSVHEMPVDGPELRSLIAVCGEGLRFLLHKGGRVVATRDFPFVYAGVDPLSQAYEIVKAELMFVHTSPDVVKGQLIAGLVGKVKMLMSGERLTLTLERVRLIVFHAAITLFFKEKLTHRYAGEMCQETGLPSMLELGANQTALLQFALDPSSLERHAQRYCPTGCDAVTALLDERDSDGGWREIACRVWAAGAALPNSLLGTLLLNLKPMHHCHMPGDRSGRSVVYGGSYKFDCVSQVGAGGSFESCTRGQPVLSKNACFVLWGVEFTALLLQMLFFPQQLDDVMQWLFSPVIMARVFEYQRGISDHHHLLNQLTERSRAYIFHLGAGEGMTTARAQLLMFDFLYAATTPETDVHRVFAEPTCRSKQAAQAVERAVEDFCKEFNSNTASGQVRSSLELQLNAWKVSGGRVLQCIPLAAIPSQLPSAPGHHSWELLEAVIYEGASLRLTGPLIADITAMHQLVHAVLSSKVAVEEECGIVQLLYAHSGSAAASHARALLQRIKATWNKFRADVGSLDYECQEGAVDFLMHEEGDEADGCGASMEDTLAFWIVSHASGAQNMIPSILGSLIDRYNRLREAIVTQHAAVRQGDLDLTHPPPGIAAMMLRDHPHVAAAVNSHTDYGLLSPKWAQVQQELAVHYAGLLPRLVPPVFAEFEYKTAAVAGIREAEQAVLPLLKGTVGCDDPPPPCVERDAADLTEQQVACTLLALAEVLKLRGDADPPLCSALRQTDMFASYAETLGEGFVLGCLAPLDRGDPAPRQRHARGVMLELLQRAERCDWLIEGLDAAYRETLPDPVADVLEAAFGQYVSAAGKDVAKEELEMVVDTLCETLHTGRDYLRPEGDLLEFLAAVTTPGEDGTLLAALQGAVTASEEAGAVTMAHTECLLVFFKRRLHRMYQGSDVEAWEEPDADPAAAAYRVPRSALGSIVCTGSLILDLGEDAAAAGLTVGTRLLAVEGAPVTAPDALRALADPPPHLTTAMSEPVEVVVGNSETDPLGACVDDVAISLSLRQSIESLPQSVLPPKAPAVAAAEPGNVFRDEERLLQKKAVLMERVLSLRRDIEAQERDLDLNREQLRLHRARLDQVRAN